MTNHNLESVRLKRNAISLPRRSRRLVWAIAGEPYHAADATHTRRSQIMICYHAADVTHERRSQIVICYHAADVTHERRSQI